MVLEAARGLWKHVKRQKILAFSTAPYDSLRATQTNICGFSGKLTSLYS